MLWLQLNVAVKQKLQVEKRRCLFKKKKVKKLLVSKALLKKRNIKYVALIFENEEDEELVDSPKGL